MTADEEIEGALRELADLAGVPAVPENDGVVRLAIRARDEPHRRGVQARGSHIGAGRHCRTHGPGAGRDR